jgi:hypothetical protein
MENITINNNNYRIKKMNAIELLSMQSQISFKSAKQTQECYEQMLERIEVQCQDKWLPVKEEGKRVYYPNGIEFDLESIQELIAFFMKWLKEVFQKSNVLK